MLQKGSLRGSQDAGSIFLETQPVAAITVFERASITMWQEPASSGAGGSPASSSSTRRATPGQRPEAASKRPGAPREGSRRSPRPEPQAQFINATGGAAEARPGADAHLDGSYTDEDSGTVSLDGTLVWTKDSNFPDLEISGTGDASVTLGYGLSLTVGYYYNLETSYWGTSIDSCTLRVTATPSVELSLDATAEASYSRLSVNLLLHFAHPCLSCAQEASLGGGARGVFRCSLPMVCFISRAPHSTAQPA